MEKHHIIFVGQGGLDFPLNYKFLTPEAHRGNNGPHMNKAVDDIYKKELEANLRHKLPSEHYWIDDVIEVLELKPSQAYKAFRHLQITSKGMLKEDIIFRLLGGRYYIGVD